jgi:hypothetical protein
MEPAVFFGVRSKTVSDKQLLAALSEVARDFDDDPKQMLCLLTPPGDTRWFTFVCSSLGKDRVMMADFFQEVLAPLLPELCVQQADERLRNQLLFRRFEGGQLRLEVRSDGRNVAVTRGEVAASIPREGDATHFGLLASGFTTEPLWKQLERPTHQVKLRPYAPKRALKIEAHTGRLPPVRAQRGSHEIGFDYFLERALEKFPLKAAAAIAEPKRLASGQAAPVRFDVIVGAPGVWPDLRGVERITGRLEVIDNYEARTWGLPSVDLFEVRELVYPSRLCVQGSTKRLIARALEKADTIESREARAVELPALHTASYLKLGPEPAVIELPALEQVKKLMIRAPYGRPLTIRLPRLLRGELELTLESSNPAELKGSVLEVPQLDRKKIKILCRTPAVVAAVKKLLG